MKSDRLQDKYDEIFQEIKEEKMNWDFDSFLEQTEKESKQNGKTIPISNYKPSSGMPKLFWMAASIALIAGIIFFTQFNNNDENLNKEDNNIAQKQTLNAPPEIVDNQTVKSKSKIIKNEKSETIARFSTEKEVIEQILPKRGRIKKDRRVLYAENQNPEAIKPEEPSEYNPNYVIINGKKIYNEAEAVQITKMAIHMFANNLNSTIQEAQPIENLTIDF